MKKLIAGAVLVTTILGAGGPALADVTGTASTTTTTSASAPAATGTTSAGGAATATTPSGAIPLGADAAATADATLPKVSVSPNSLFYSVKLLIEKIQLAITSNAVNKATLLEQQAQTRLAEAKAMADAGHADLARQALDEAKAKFAAAQAQIEIAAKANRDVTKLSTRLEEDQTRFAKILTVILAKAPAEVKAQVEPAVADLLVQVAAAQDAAKPDVKLQEQAQKLEKDAKHKKELSDLQPRLVVVLGAMAKASGKSLDDVTALYVTNPHLGHLAQALGLKMGPVEHAAQLQWVLITKDGKVTVQVQAPATPPQSPTGTVQLAQTPALPIQTPAQTPAQTVTVVTGVKVKVDKQHDDQNDNDDEHDDDHAKVQTQAQVQVQVPQFKVFLAQSKGQKEQNGQHGEQKGHGHGDD